MYPELRKLHIQLTRRCNLRCHFCGQDHCEPENSLQEHEIFHLLDQLEQYAPDAEVTLWGGEPLLSRHFQPVVEYAAARGFALSLITNGTLIDRYADVLRENFSKIYISVDGPEHIHDLIRGQGVFAEIKKNMKLLSGFKGEVISMSVCSPETMEHIHEVPFGLPFDRSILHELIYVTEEECAGLPEDFAEKWRKNEAADYQNDLKKTIEKLKTMSFPLPVEFQPHNAPVKCIEPFSHLHVGVTGETCFCTDFTEKSLGNIRDFSLKEIFEGQKAWEFREKGNMPFCAHCPWKNAEDTIIRFKTTLCSR